MGTARYFLAGCGTNTAALAIGGYTNTAVSSVEEFNDPSIITKTLTS